MGMTLKQNSEKQNTFEKMMEICQNVQKKLRECNTVLVVMH